MADDKPGNREDGTMRVDAKLVRELAELLATNDLTEIEVEDGDRKIKVRREAAPVAAQVVHAAPATVAAAPAVAPSAPVEDAAPAVSGETIKSPMVGTAFLSPEPGSRPFIEAGQSVRAGETLLIVEAMKVMNPITAPKAGVVRQILVADAQPIEFDQPLVVIE